MDDKIEMEDFCQHPGWRKVFETLEQARQDFMVRAARASALDHEVCKGRLEGAEQIVTLIKVHKEKGWKES